MKAWLSSDLVHTRATWLYATKRVSKMSCWRRASRRPTTVLRTRALKKPMHRRLADQRQTTLARLIVSIVDRESTATRLRQLSSQTEKSAYTLRPSRGWPCSRLRKRSPISLRLSRIYRESLRSNAQPKTSSSSCKRRWMWRTLSIWKPVGSQD